MNSLVYISRIFLPLLFVLLTVSCGGSTGSGPGKSNSAPTISNQTSSTNEDSTVAITLDASDAEGDPLSYSVGSPQHGSLSGLAPNLSYTPDTDFNGTDSFTVSVNDGSIDSTVATISITVHAINDEPLAYSQNVAATEDTPVNINLTATDVESDPLSYNLGAPSNGILSGTPPDLVYTPNSNFFGNDSFTFTVNDGSLDSSPATISISITGTYDPPVADAQSTSTDEDFALNIILSGSDPDGNSLGYNVTAPAHGTLSGTAPDLLYTPDSNFNGSDSFSFTVNDGTTDSAAATVSIIINPVNDTPVADSQDIVTAINSAVSVTLSGSDIETGTLTYMLVSTPTHGGLSGTVPDLTYTPDTDYVGDDSFTFSVNDGATDSITATISIAVNPIAVLSFSDANLEACVNDAASAAGVTYGYEILSLDCSSRNISDLGGIEQLTGLQQLILNHNNVSNFNPLLSLTNLTDLRLDFNNISDITTLGSLTGLTELHLDTNNLGDISALSSLTNLLVLRLGHNHISDVSALSAMNSLLFLNMGTNNISNLAPLKPGHTVPERQCGQRCQSTGFADHAGHPVYL